MAKVKFLLNCEKRTDPKKGKEYLFTILKGIMDTHTKTQIKQTEEIIDLVRSFEFELPDELLFSGGVNICDIRKDYDIKIAEKEKARQRPVRKPRSAFKATTNKYHKLVKPVTVGEIKSPDSIKVWENPDIANITAKTKTKTLNQ